MRWRMMPSRAVAGAAILTWSALLPNVRAGVEAPTPLMVRVTISMALVLKDLTLRPVPRHEVLIDSKAGAATPMIGPRKLVTGFDGAVQIELAPGEYRIVVSQEVELEGQRYTWDLPLNVPVGTSEVRVELSNDNATVAAAEARETSATPEGRVFKDCKEGVVTVESDLVHGSGFVVDPSGLVLTNAHVVEGARELAVEFDNTHRFVAERLAVDGEDDLAVLRFNPAAYPEARVLKLAFSHTGTAPLHEGDVVIAIGSPLNQEKIVTRGIVSKIQDRAIISDVNINHGNSGGPLLTTAEEVVGVTAFKDLDSGGSVAGIIRIEQAEEILKKAREQATQQATPEARALPPFPEKPFPLDELKKLIQGHEFRPKDYSEKTSTFLIQFVTPPLKYYMETKAERDRAQALAKRQRKAGKRGEEAGEDPYAGLKSWRMYVGDYKPVVELYMVPRLRAISENNPKYRYKSDFDRAELLVDGKEIAPLRRARLKHRTPHDITYGGLYTYSADLFKDLPPDSRVTLVLHDSMKPKMSIEVRLAPPLTKKIQQDMAPVTAKP